MPKIANWSKETEKHWRVDKRGYSGFLKIVENQEPGEKKWKVICKVDEHKPGYAHSDETVFIREKRRATVDEAKDVGYGLMREANKEVLK